MEIKTSTNWDIDNPKLRQLNESKDPKIIADPYGGLSGLAKLLRVDLDNGIGADEVKSNFADRSQTFGKNEFDEPPAKSFFHFFINAMKEPILILLLVFSIISIIVGVAFPEPGHEKTGWIEGFAILLAVFLVSSVSSFNDWSKERKFRALNKIKNERLVKVIRAGVQDRVSITTIQCGDVVILDTGDWIPADGIFIEGHDLAVDESSMTGESDQVKKTAQKPFLLSGCQVSTGSGKMLVTAVGMNSEWGITYSKLTEERDPTPLQEMLTTLAKMVGYVGMSVAALLFIVLTISYIVEETTDDVPFKASNLRVFIKFVLLCITIVVVAVPEGLPLAVTISLAYSMKSMLKDNNLVRHLNACETMGGATNICSDKTGTLTENKMTVTHVWMGGQIIDGELKETIPAKVDKDMVKLFCTAMDVNSTAFLKYPTDKIKKMEFIGSKTECALIVLSDVLGHEYNEVRKQQKIVTLFPFSSDRKRMSTLVQHKAGSRLFVKGASEIILGMCDTYLDPQGKEKALTAEDKETMKSKVIESLAAEGLRTLTIAYKDLDECKEEWETPPEDKLILIGIVGIQDPVRKEVPPAIQRCKTAGITVRMVTGDNKLTASRIAKDCGILEEGADYVVMEGPVFRAMSDEELDKVIPKLRVLARSSPSDKHRLVTRLRFHREVVAVTGDGTNDAPALKAADVGMAMGIAGTEVAKEASDIIIMDDNFASIVKAVMWGRAVRQNIQKFLQFQLTVNAVALVIAFVFAAIGKGEPLTPVQLLWVNLIQDTFAALALATEKPSEELLEEKPAGRNERLITPIMWRNVFSTALYQLIIIFFILFGGERCFGMTEDEGVDYEHDRSVLYTMAFNTFVLMQLCNEINARRLDRKWNAFEGFFRNPLFLVIVFGTLAAQILIVFVGGIPFSVKHMTWKYWLICIAFAVSIFPFGVINRVVIPVPDFKWLKYQSPPKKKKGGDDSDGEAEENDGAMELPVV